MRIVLAFIRFFDRQPRWILSILAVGALCGLGLADYFSRDEVFLGLSHLIPISFAAWHLGQRWGIVLSVLGAAAGMFADISAGGPVGHGWVLWWDTGARLAVFVAVTLLLSALRFAHDHEMALARTDSLTGAANNRWFREQLDREILRSRRYRRPFTLIYGDLDDFKRVNDELGHSAGDALLREVADVMRRGVRATDTVGRLGGDEFAILLPETDQDAGSRVAQEVRQRVLDVMRRNDWPVSGSFGVVTSVNPPSAAAVLGRADELMYAAKREDKGSVRHAVLVGEAEPAHATS